MQKLRLGLVFRTLFVLRSVKRWVLQVLRLGLVLLFHDGKFILVLVYLVDDQSLLRRLVKWQSRHDLLVAQVIIDVDQLNYQDSVFLLVIFSQTPQVAWRLVLLHCESQRVSAEFELAKRKLLKEIEVRHDCLILRFFEIKNQVKMARTWFEHLLACTEL